MLLIKLEVRINANLRVSAQAYPLLCRQGGGEAVASVRVGFAQDETGDRVRARIAPETLDGNRRSLKNQND